MGIKHIFILVFFITLTEFLVYYIIRENSDKNIELYLNQKTQDFKTKATSSINTYNLVSRTIFNEAVNKREILALYAQANNADSAKKEAIRESLLETLGDTYRNLKEVNIRQLHFHLPDNTSFLRFHRPTKHGDNLTDFRYSVKMANKTQKIYSGFEEGRIFNGFRYVFPLLFEGVHIGSVETSFSFDAIRKELDNHDFPHTAFLIDKRIVNDKVFTSEKSNYVDSELSGQYVQERKYLHYKDKPSLKAIDVLIRPLIQNQISRYEDFTIEYNELGTPLLISFVCIKNTEGLPAAYIVGYQNDNTVNIFKKQYSISLYIALFLAPVFIILIFLYLKKAEMIRSQNSKLKQSEGKLKIANSKLVAQSEELISNNEKLFDLNNTKNRFFSIIAHDLKNPFNALIGLSKIAIEEIKDSKNQRLHQCCNLIHQTAHHSSDLLDNLLQWSRIQTGKFDFSPSTVYLESIVSNITELLDANLNVKQLKFEKDIPKDFHFQADNLMLETILRNLLSNAIKYTKPNGTIKLKASKSEGTILISVSDNGIGIDAKNLEKIFKIDSNFSTKGTNSEKGTGLGLILCKEFVEKHNGEIWAESEIGIGTTFSFTLKMPYKNMQPAKRI